MAVGLPDKLLHTEEHKDYHIYTEKPLLHLRQKNHEQSTRNKKLTMIIFSKFYRYILAKKGEFLRMSTATSRTAPFTTRTNLLCAKGGF